MLNITTTLSPPAVFVGKWQATQVYYNYSGGERRDDVKDEVLEANGLAFVHNSNDNVYAAYNKHVAAKLGAKFNARLRAASYDVWIKPIKHILDKHCLLGQHGGNLRNFSYLPRLIPRAHAMKDTIKTMEKDGQLPLIPLAILFCCTPSEIRKHVGKGRWKYLCKLPHSVVMKLMLTLYKLEENMFIQFVGDTYIANQMLDTRPPTACFWLAICEVIDICRDIKNTLIDRHLLVVFKLVDNGDGTVNEYFEQAEFSFEPEFNWQPALKAAQDKLLANIREQGVLLRWLNRHCRVSNKQEIERYLAFFNDTRKMCNKVGEKMALSSKEALKSQHDRLTAHFRDAILQRMRAQRDARREGIIKELGSYHESQVIIAEKLSQTLAQHPTLNARVLTGGEDYLDEAEEMAHCLVNYLGAAHKGVFVALSLRPEGQQRTTLSLAKDKGVWSKHQHFGYDNEVVENPALYQDFTDRVCATLNGDQ